MRQDGRQHPATLARCVTIWEMPGRKAEGRRVGTALLATDELFTELNLQARLRDLSLWLSVNRRRTVLQLAVGVCLLMIAERRVVIHEQGALASAAHNPQVAQSVLGDLLHGYFVLTGWVLGVALVVLVIAVLVIAVLSGPYRWAVAFRSQVTRTWRSIAAASSGDRRGQVVTWMASHAAGLQ